MTDDAGKGLGGITVQWQVTSGRGSFFAGPPPLSVTETATLADGTSSVIFMPRALGAVTVIASAGGVDPAAFEVDVATYVFTTFEEWWYGGFYGPGGEVDASVPAGTTVEWVNRADRDIRIRSTSVPPAGTPFNVNLRPLDRFQLEMSVPGYWDWHWEYEGTNYADVATISVGDVPPGPSPALLAARVSARYQELYNVSVPRPAFVNSGQRSGCQVERHVMTTAYLPAQAEGARRLIAMYLASDGLYSTRRYERVIRSVPAGRLPVLTVLLTYPETTGEDALALLHHAQAEINAQHERFAVERGYASPIVQFEFENTTVPGSEIGFDPRHLAGIRAGLREAGVNVDDYEFVVVLNPDPGRVEGGVAHLTSSPPYFVYMGNFGPWKTQLTDRNFASMAWAAYHHEIGHHWGWEHEWTPTCGGSAHSAYFAPFITDPALFGWEDLDGDGIPEILDPHPYGR